MQQAHLGAILSKQHPKRGVIFAATFTQQNIQESPQKAHIKFCLSQGQKLAPELPWCDKCA